MKKILFGFLFLFCSNFASASADTAIGIIWEEISASENFHLLDNATPASFYDFNKGEWLAGVSTSFYKYGRLSVDFGGIKTMEKSDTILPLIGLNGNFKARSDNDFKFLENLSIGVWYCREFVTGRNLFGVYGGYAAKW